MELAGSIETGDRHVHIHEFPTSRTVEPNFFVVATKSNEDKAPLSLTPISQPRVKWSVSRVVHPLQE
jgi:hypothetical protein